MRHIFFLACFISMVSFAQTSTVITGICRNNPNYKKVFLDEIATNKAVASDTIKPDGTFTIKIPITSGSLYKLRFSYEGQGLYMVVNPGEKINVNVDLNDINNPVITGSEDSKLLYAMITELKRYDAQIADETRKLQNARKEYLYSTMKKNSGSLAVLFFTDQETIDGNLELMKLISNDLAKKYSDNAFVKDLSSKVEEASFLATGTPAPEIELPDTTGKIIKLSSLKGKYVLIDFWASWCGPCRQSNPKLVSLYNKYKGKNFEIYGISLDRNKDAWLAAIKSDKLNWIHVSDLKYWESTAAVQYRVSGIPYSVLIDPQGLIIAKGLHPDQLEAKMKEIIK